MTDEGADLAILIPLWRRAQHIERVADSARAATPAARLVFIVSRDDPLATMTLPGERVFARGSGGQQGDYAIKINDGLRATTEPFVFTGADDLDFHAGWYQAAQRAMFYRERDGAFYQRVPEHIGVVGTVDDCNGRTMDGSHSTHSLVARWYAECCAVIDQPGAIYHEGYYHEYCDDELVGYAKSRGAYAHAFDAHVEHLHPLVGKSPDDDTYRHGRAFSRASRRRFTYRRQLWEPR